MRRVGLLSVVVVAAVVGCGQPSLEPKPGPELPPPPKFTEEKNEKGGYSKKVFVDKGKPPKDR